MKSSINHIHVLCQDWKRELNFFKDEIPLFKKRLEEIVNRNTDKSILAEVEHFENKFRIMQLHLDELLHDVKLKISSISDKANTQANYINVKMVDTDLKMEDLMNFTSKDFYETKQS